MVAMAVKSLLTRRVRMLTLIWALAALVVPVRAERGDWRCATTVNCDDSTVAAECGIPHSDYPNLSVEMHCNEVVSCLYGVNGICKYCTSDCREVTNDGNSLEVVAELTGDTCKLNISLIPNDGVNLSSWAKEVTNDCNVTLAPHNGTDDLSQGGRATGSRPAIVSLLISTLCALHMVLP